MEYGFTNSKVGTPSKVVAATCEYNMSLLDVNCGIIYLADQFL